MGQERLTALGIVWRRFVRWQGLASPAQARHAQTGAAHAAAAIADPAARPTSAPPMMRQLIRKLAPLPLTATPLPSPG